MSSTKEIRRRIKSIRSTHQITKAMELVSAAKMRRAQLSALGTRTYSGLAWDLVKRLTQKAHPRWHKLLRRPRTIKKVAILLITSNRGLIGNFNNQIINTAAQYAKQYQEVEFITLGKKGYQAIRKKGRVVVADFEKKETAVSIIELLPVARLLLNDFIEGRYDKIALAYMDFITTLRQEPRLLELLPLVPKEVEEIPEYRIPDSEYLFEPTPDEVLEVLLPRLTEMQIYQAFLETVASEHSARMVAMKNASDAAKDLIYELTLEYNQARQAAITKEISEIVAGKLALT